jgi:serine acetyltransferase
MGTLARAFRAYRYLHAIHIKPVTERTWLERFALRHGKPIYERTLSKRFGGTMPISASIGKNLRLPHFLHGIFIAGDAVIGDDVVILHWEDNL